MLFLVVATIILPGILGCCMPKQMTGSNYETENKAANHFLIDFDQNKFIARPLVPSAVNFVLSDFASAKTHIMMKDGTCRTVSLPQSQSYARCIPANSSAGNFYMGPKGSVNVQTFRYQIGQNNVLFALSDKCLPIISVGKFGTITRTTIYANVTSMVTDLSDLNQDVDNCVESAG